MADQRLDETSAEGAADGQPGEAAAEPQQKVSPTSLRPRSGGTMRSQLLMLKAQQQTPRAAGPFDSSGQLKPLNSKGSTLITELPGEDAILSALRPVAEGCAPGAAAKQQGQSSMPPPQCQLLPRTAAGRRRDESMRRSGLLARPSLRSTAPPWWEVPPKVCLAADAFDHRHNGRVRSAEALMRGLSVDTTSLSKAASFDQALREVRWNRYQLDSLGDGAEAEADASASAAAAAKRAAAAAGSASGTGGVEGDAWSLDNSIWAPRRQWCDARDFYDTDSVHRRMFECDWERALSHSSLSIFIVRNDDDGGADADGDGRPDEIDEVRDVVWEHHQLLTTVFDFYASRGSSRDPFCISQNGFNLFVAQCRLAVPGSTACQVAHLDQLFLEANAGRGAPRNQSKKHNAARALTRHEFLQCIVHIAVARYVKTGRCPDVSDAIRTLCAADIDQRVDPAALQDSNAYRARYCYTPAVSATLARHEASLRALFDAYAGADDSISASSVGRLGSASLMSHEELQCMCADLGLFTPIFTRREATLAFLWSRMRYVDEMDDASRTKMVHLSFEDFLEFVTRVAAMAPLPTDDEIQQGGFEDAGELILELRFGDPRSYEEYVRARAGRWDEEPEQSMERCVEHLLWVLIRTVEAAAGTGAGDGRLSSREAGSFLRQGSQRDGTVAAAAAAYKRKGGSAMGGPGRKHTGLGADPRATTPRANTPRQQGAAAGRQATHRHMPHVAVARA